MAWIESHQSLGGHPKTKRLARLLDITRRDAVGLMHCLWWWALDYAQDGDLTAHDPADIADAVDFEGEPKDLIEALVACGVGGEAGFVENQNGSLLIHDWDEYVGRLILRRKADANRKREWRKSDANRTAGGRDADATRDGVRTQPTEPTQPTEEICRPDEQAERWAEEIRDVCQHYLEHHPRARMPRSDSKEWKRIRRHLQAGWTVVELKLAIDGCHKTPHNQGENKTRTKYLGLDLIMRDDSHVQRFMENSEATPGRCRVPTDAELAEWVPS